ncbi:MAG: SDR family NAD(P)-dependent oxidoreductase, partial [Deltaproteobacteria bacterium]
MSERRVAMARGAGMKNHHRLDDERQEARVGLLEGRVAVVTGAGGGIGRAVAMLFAREGARVVVNDVGCARDGEGASAGPADAVVAEIVAAGGEAVANHDSVVDLTGAQRIVDAAEQCFGGVDVLVNNAGIARDMPFVKMDPADFDAVVAVQLRGAFNVARCAARRMIQQKHGGKIVNTTSLCRATSRGLSA